MEEKVFFEGELGKVCGILNNTNNSDELVILLHGFSSSKDTSAAISAKELEKIGIDSLRIDFDNQGESELDFKTQVSIPNYIKQVEASINYVKSAGYKEINLIGTSFGGLIALNVAHKYPEIKKLFLRALVYDYKEHLEWKFSKDKLKEFKKQNKIPYYDKNGNEHFFSYDCYESGKEFSIFEHGSKIKQSIEIIQGDTDESINHTNASKIIQILPNAKLHIIEGAKHNLGVNGDFSESIKHLLNFFKS